MPIADCESDVICLFCGRWHPNIRYSPLVDDWIGEQCLLTIIERNPHDEVARLVADELGLNFANSRPTEITCDFCGGNADVIDEFEDSKICLACWKKIKPA